MSDQAIQAVNQTTVVLLAAGRGQRMMPLTENTPKPLLKVGQYSLIEHHLRALANQGFSHVVINLAYLAEQITAALGDGSRFGLSIEYSDESASGALETAGGLRKALDLIKSEYFLVINADTWTDYCFADLLKANPNAPSNCLGKLVMVPNPEHNPEGDFALHADGQLGLHGEAKLTFSGIARYQRKMFSELEQGRQALAPLFKTLIQHKQLEGELFCGEWVDIGTPERLSKLNQDLLNDSNK